MLVSNQQWIFRWLRELYGLLLVTRDNNSVEMTNLIVSRINHAENAFYGVKDKNIKVVICNHTLFTVISAQTRKNKQLISVHITHAALSSLFMSADWLGLAGLQLTLLRKRMQRRTIIMDDYTAFQIVKSDDLWHSGSKGGFESPDFTSKAMNRENLIFLF